MDYVVRAYPLQDGKLDALVSFAQECEARQEETDAFYRRYGVRHESWHIQHSERGTWVIAIAILEDAGGAAPRFAASQEPFDAWFKAQVLELSGVDANRDPLGPPTFEVFRFDTSAAQTVSCAIAEAEA